MTLILIDKQERITVRQTDSTRPTHELEIVLENTIDGGLMASLRYELIGSGEDYAVYRLMDSGYRTYLRALPPTQGGL